MRDELAGCSPCGPQLGAVPFSGSNWGFFFPHGPCVTRGARCGLVLVPRATSEVRKLLQLRVAHPLLPPMRGPWVPPSLPRCHRRSRGKFLAVFWRWDVRGAEDAQQSPVSIQPPLDPFWGPTRAPLTAPKPKIGVSPSLCALVAVPWRWCLCRGPPAVHMDFIISLTFLWGIVRARELFFFSYFFFFAHCEVFWFRLLVLPPISHTLGSFLLFSQMPNTCEGPLGSNSGIPEMRVVGAVAGIWHQRVPVAGIWRPKVLTFGIWRPRLPGDGIWHPRVLMVVPTTKSSPLAVGDGRPGTQQR